jgi:hypothetical protein
MSHFLDYILSNPSDPAHLSAYIWLLFIIVQVVLSIISKPKGITERLIILFQKPHILLLGSAIIMTGYIFSPVIKIDGGMMHMMVKASELHMNVNFPVIGNYLVFVCLIAALITIGLNLLAIFLFKFRRLQAFFCWLSIIPAVFCFCYTYYRMTTTDMIQDQLFYYGNISPVVAVVLIFMVMFFIRKDDELVKSADRLR